MTEFSRSKPNQSPSPTDSSAPVPGTAPATSPVRLTPAGDPSQQVAAMDNLVLQKLGELGIVPPYHLETIVADICAGLAQRRGMRVVVSPYTTDDSGIHGMVSRHGDIIVALYITNANRLAELLSILHELAHIILEHPIPTGPVFVERPVLKSFLVFDDNDGWAEAFGATTIRMALGSGSERSVSARNIDQTVRPSTPFGQFLDDIGRYE